MFAMANIIALIAINHLENFSSKTIFLSAKAKLDIAKFFEVSLKTKNNNITKFFFNLTF